MFHPVGSQPPTVYWRRRLFLIGSVVLVLVLAVLTFNAVRSNGDGRANAGSPATSTSSSAGSSTRVAPTATRTSSAASSSRRKSSSSAGTSSASGREPATATTQAAAPDCAASNLQLRSVAGKSGYRIGDTPLLQLQVTNIGPQPCVENLADKQVEMRVYNGESRIWGSHDCKVESGTTDRTLTPKVSVLVSIQWSGLTSKPGCGGTRQRVGSGTYTLYTSLAGHQAHAGQFTIS